MSPSASSQATSDQLRGHTNQAFGKFSPASPENGIDTSHACSGSRRRGDLFAGVPKTNCDGVTPVHVRRQPVCEITANIDTLFNDQRQRLGVGSHL